MSSSKIVALTLCLSLTMACGKSDKSKPAPLTEEMITGLEELEVANTRNYVAGCAPFGQKEDKAAATHTFELKMNGADADFNWSTKFYNSNCEILILSTEFIGHGRFRDNKLKAFEAEATKAYMTSLNYYATDDFNKKAACGYQNWQTNDKKDILNTDCFKSPKNNFFFDRKGKDIILYACNEGEALSRECDAIVFQKK